MLELYSALKDKLAHEGYDSALKMVDEMSASS